MLATVDASGAADTTKACVRFLVQTACRSGEVRGATWDEIDAVSVMEAEVATKTGANLGGRSSERITYRNGGSSLSVTTQMRR